MSKNLLWLSCAASALLLSAGAAQAATADAAATTAAADNSAASVSEIVVVAEHRETSLQKIPVAVSVFSGKERDVVGITSVQDVTNFAPGFTYDPGNVHAYIRGVGRQSINVTDDSRVASYEDEFYVYSPYQLDKSSLFLSQEQIERGPQSVGGKNAAGGSIDMVSVRPTDHPYAEVRASVGNFGSYNIEGAASGEVAPGLDVRLAAYDHNQDQGFYNNVANGQSEGNLIHEWYVEAQADWKPNDKTELWTRAFYSGWQNRGDAGARSGFEDGSWDETNLTDANAYPGAGLFVNPNFGYAALSPAARAGAAANPANAISAGPAAGLPYLPSSATLLTPGIMNNPSATNPSDFAAVEPRSVKLGAYDGIQTSFTYDITDGIQFRYIGGYQQYDYTLNYSEPDTDVTSFTMPSFTAAPALVINPLVNLNYKEDDGWWSHEFSLQSTDKSPLQWTVGVYYNQQHYINPIAATAPDQPQFAHPDSYLAFDGITAPAGTLTPAAANPNNYIFYQDYSITNQDEAAYGQVSYAFNDQLKVTGNLRFTQDHKYGEEYARYVSFNDQSIDGFAPYYGAATPSFDVTALLTCPTGTGLPASGSCFAGPLAPGVASAAAYGADGIEARALSAYSSAVTGGAGVEWTPTNDIFVYARYGRGYEAMSFNAGYISSAPEVMPEFLNSYELGYKQSFGRTLSIDLAAFYYDYDNFQLPITVANGPLTSGEFVNVPKAESTGIEFEGNWSPVKDLNIGLSYSYDYTAVLTGCSGTVANPNTNAAKFVAATGALCLLDTNDPYGVESGASVAAGQSLTTIPKAIGFYQSVKGDPLPDAPRNKLAIDVAYTWHFEPGDLTLSSAWVWRDTQDGTVFDRSYDNAPSWDDFDLRALWRGPEDRYEVIGYVKNVFNTLQYEVGDGGAGLLGNATSATTAAAGLYETNLFTLAPPRTYGLEVRYKFF
jgi:iron complex outermembrane receptor protein